MLASNSFLILAGLALIAAVANPINGRPPLWIAAVLMALALVAPSLPLR